MTVEAATTQQVIVQVVEPSILEALVTEPCIIEVITAGPQGPLGGAYTYQQVSPALQWTINHNLGFKPSVELLNSGSQEIEGDIVHTSNNQVLVTFTSYVSGTARLV